MTLDLGDVLAHRFTTPAPTAGDPDQYPHTPWRPRVVTKACCGEVLDGEDCDCAELAAQVATAPVIWLGPTGRRAA